MIAIAIGGRMKSESGHANFIHALASAG